MYILCKNGGIVTQSARVYCDYSAWVLLYGKSMFFDYNLCRRYHYCGGQWRGSQTSFQPAEGFSHQNLLLTVPNPTSITGRWSIFFLWQRCN